MADQLEHLQQEWRSLEKEYQDIEASHKKYLERLTELEKVQKAAVKSLKEHEKKFSSFKHSLKRLEEEGLVSEDKFKLTDLLTEVGDKKHSVQTMLDELPKYDNGPYLNIILGTNIPLGLLRKEEKFRYKDEYEKFKLSIQLVTFLLASFALICSFRWVDAIFHFLLVWYPHIPLGLLRKEEKFRYKDEYGKFKLSIQLVTFLLASFALICSFRWVDTIFHFLLLVTFLLASVALICSFRWVDTIFHFLLVWYPHIPLGLLRKEEKFRYKDKYEKFKLSIQLVTFLLASFAPICSLRWVDAIFHFLLVWYYCTLTIRESILRLNGSRIKGWWVAHHYLSTLLCGISLTWPDGECYQSFRLQFLCFSLYLSVVQWLQVQYQRGILYRLKSLGQSHDMDITVDGFQTYMFKGLSFIIPFLFLAYLLQLYNAYRLLYIYKTKGCQEWQVIALAVLFLILAVGNSVTTGMVMARKYADKLKPLTGLTRRRLITKYSTAGNPKPKTN